ncbi:MAG: hypothetical protein KDA80_20960 [Planctomycetaceae bacterium]|nr:hypothetical protein [Planctomycetaceae bacterium]
MFMSDLACLNFQECKELPPATLMASLPIIREIRCALRETPLNLVVGQEDAVFVSTDLFNAFNAWEATQDDLSTDGPDSAWLN